MTESEIRAEFARMLEYIATHHGLDVKVRLVIDRTGSYPRPRDFAKTTGSTIYVSPKLIGSDVERVRGLLYHEVGHVLLMQSGDFDHPEDYADYVAELCFQTPIYYDSEDVQTTAKGERPRPSHLPQN